MAYSSDIRFVSVCPECVRYSQVMAYSIIFVLSVYVLNEEEEETLFNHDYILQFFSNL